MLEQIFVRAPGESEVDLLSSGFEDAQHIFRAFPSEKNASDRPGALLKFSLRENFNLRLRGRILPGVHQYRHACTCVFY